MPVEAPFDLVGKFFSVLYLITLKPKESCKQQGKGSLIKTIQLVQ